MAYTSYKDYLLAEYRKWIELPENIKYKVRHEELTALGFELDTHYLFRSFKEGTELNKDRFLQVIEYRYYGNFSVHGDHAYDVFMVIAKSYDDDHTLFIYSSSYIDVCYIQEGGLATREEADKSVEMLKRFVAKRIDRVGIDIDIFEINGEAFFTHCAEKPSVEIMDAMANLAVMLDEDTRRKFCFCEIKDYEDIYNKIIEKNGFDSIPKYTYPEDECTNWLIGSCYKITLNELIAKTEALLEKTKAENEDKTKLISIFENLLNLLLK